MAEGLRKAKKLNFTEVEMETLVGEVEARKVILFWDLGSLTLKSSVSGNMLLRQ